MGYPGIRGLGSDTASQRLTLAATAPFWLVSLLYLELVVKHGKLMKSDFDVPKGLMHINFRNPRNDRGDEIEPDLPPRFFMCVAKAPVTAVDQTVAQYRGSPCTSTSTGPARLGGI